MGMIDKAVALGSPFFIRWDLTEPHLPNIVPEFRGQSLIPLMSGERDNGRHDIFATFHGNQFGLYSQRMVRDRHWEYVWNLLAEDELYDLQADPGEVHNLATDPACRGELQRLRERLVSRMEDTHDSIRHDRRGSDTADLSSFRGGSDK
jgi:arylsulfatase A-like enzyme